MDYGEHVCSRETLFSTRESPRCSGHRDHSQLVGARFAAEGYLCAVVGYNIYPEANALDQARCIREVAQEILNEKHQKKSICFKHIIPLVRKHAEGLGGDPNQSDFHAKKSR